MNGFGGIGGAGAGGMGNMGMPPGMPPGGGGQNDLMKLLMMMMMMQGNEYNPYIKKSKGVDVAEGIGKLGKLAMMMFGMPFGGGRM